MGLKYDQDRASSAHRTAMRGSRKLTGAGHVTQQRLTGAGDVAPTALTKWHWDVNSNPQNYSHPTSWGRLAKPEVGAPF